MNQPDSCALAVVVVTHNSAPWLAEFFRSWEFAVANAPALQARGSRIIVADSGSSDRTLDTVRICAPAATIIECGHVGYGAAANRGIQAAGAADAKNAGTPEWLLLCNPDLTFPENLAARLIDPLLSPESQYPPCPWRTAACIAPALRNPDQTPQPSAGQFPTLRALVQDQFRPRESRKYLTPQPQAAGPIDWASGACLLLNRKAFQAVAGFDERFFLYVEELDLQRRLADRGFSTWFLPQANVIHHAPNAARAPRPEVQRWAARGMLRYFAKFGSTPQLLGYRLMALAGRRLKFHEALAPRGAILQKATGP